MINGGSDQPISILELARRVIARVDPSLEIRFQGYEEAYSKSFEDCRHRVPVLDKLRAAIGFEPEYDLDRIIAETLAWKREST